MRIVTPYNYSSIVVHAFGRYFGDPDGKLATVLIFLEPAQKQSITHGLAIVASLTLIEKNVRVALEKLLDNSINGFTKFSVIGRRPTILIYDAKLIGTLAPDGLVVNKSNAILHTICGLKTVGLLADGPYRIRCSHVEPV